MTKLYVVERTYQNSTEVNKYFSEIGKKNYRGDSWHKSTFMHVVISENGKIETFAQPYRTSTYYLLVTLTELRFVLGNKEICS